MRLGDTHVALGQIDQAREAWRQALDLYRTQHRTTEEKHLRLRLTALDAQQIPAGCQDGNPLR